MAEFSQILEDWYAQNGRYDLPWRQTDDPYLIWISEIILQQTRVAQGYDYYQRFAERFPDVFSLANAEEDEVLKMWQGLGYYSRARNLHCAAKSVAEAGKFPESYDGVRRLKGIGDYTAAAICSFAYRQPHAVVDGNVYRVLSRIFGIETPIDSTEGKKQFAELAHELLDKKNPHIYNSAIMDFGALQCVPKSPDCTVCPFARRCLALQNNTVVELPIKAKKTAVTNRYFVYVYIEDGKNLLLHRRGAGDIWQGLYEPYLIEFPTQPEDNEVIECIMHITDGKGCVKLVAKGKKHNLTHRKLWIDCYRLTLDTLPEIDGFLKISKSARHTCATPKIVADLFRLIDGE